LENGIDSKYIQGLLGHKHSRAREIYAFVSRKFLGKIGSTLDTIKEERGRVLFLRVVYLYCRYGQVIGKPAK